MKNSEILRIYANLNELSNCDIKLPGVINFVRKVNINTLKPLVETAQESYDELLKKYGNSEDGYRYTVPTENIEAFTKERTEIDTLEVDVELQRFDSEILKSLDIEAKYFDILFELTN